MPAMVVTPDGWSVPRQHVNYLRYVVAHKPPRPGALWFQFQVDATSPSPWFLWAWAAVNVVYGFQNHYWGPLAFSAFLYAAYLLMLRMASGQLRHCPAAVAVIDDVARFCWWSRRVSTAVVPTDEGEVRLVALTELVKGFVGDGRRAEVVFLHVQHARYCQVIAARALRDAAPDPVPIESASPAGPGAERG
jgi:hypothetical protein